MKFWKTLSIELGHVMVGSDVFQQVQLESERLRQGGFFQSCGGSWLIKLLCSSSAPTVLSELYFPCLDSSYLFKASGSAI